MRLLPILFLLAVASAATSTAADDKIKQAVEQGIVTRDFINTLNDDDVPSHWKVKKAVKDTGKFISHVYSRNDVKVLEVMWAKDWTGEKEKMFLATLYHGDRRLQKVIRLGDSTSIMPSLAKDDYLVITSIQDDGAVIITVTDEAAFFERIIVKGRDTRPIDDLQYTREALSMDGIVKPLLKIVEDLAEKKTKKKARSE